VPDVHDPLEEGVTDRVWIWTVRGLYTALIAANLWLAWDWWAQSDSGKATIDRWAQRIGEAKVKLQECEGCAQRKARVQAAINRMHWQASQIVEGQDVETETEP
jgi:hypothetical protein